TKDEGEPLKVYESKDETQETRKIVKDIALLVNKGESLNDIAILFRVNALSRALEEGLNKFNINYKLVGGIRFYERAEIKDLIAYFRVITNLDDNFSIKRVINKPRRGIGKTTLEKLESESLKRGQTILKFMKDSTPEELFDLVGKKNARTLKVFIASLEDLQDLLKTSKVDFIEQFEEYFDFKSTYEKVVDYTDRVANIDEFYGYVRDFFLNNKDLTLEDFLNEIALQSAADQIDENYISLMSVHASKGLEFKHIFIIGMEEGFFPIIGDGTDIEEERRLGYVAITRAKDNLTMSCVRSRFYKGRRSQLERSRFFVESELIKGSLTIDKKFEYKKNDIVKHKLFGMGKIDSVSKSGKDLKLKINFGGIYRDIVSSFVEKV
ncbi:MAG: ATP-dependent helicase, partial [Campylobacterota bacterium]|nr:ATP-dependent helicase [Campylobacterota bacterium]